MDQVRRLIEALGSRARRVRMDALGALHLLRCLGPVGDGVVPEAAGRILHSFHSRDADERSAIARFLETWFLDERSSAHSRRIRAARMEEVDEGIRDSLLSAAFSAMPSEDLIQSLAEPEEEHLRRGLGLLMMIEAVAFRVSAREFTAGELARLILVLRAARAIRGSHIARPFLWRLEDVISSVMSLALRFRIEA